jgi:hypothetical protein
MFKVLSTYICCKKIYKMQHLDGGGAWPSFKKNLGGPQGQA